MRWPEKGKSGDRATRYKIVAKWVKRLKEKAAKTDPSDYVQPIKALQEMVANDPMLRASTRAMFIEANKKYDETPIGSEPLKDWDEFLSLLNEIMQTSPEFIVEEGTDIHQGLVGFPINAVLDWPMGTAGGLATFKNEKFNSYFKNVLNYWSRYLVTVPSREVLAVGGDFEGVVAIPWLSEQAKEQLVEVAMQPYPPTTPTPKFEEIFDVPDPADTTYYGFMSWDAFFVRDFNDDQRPIGDAVIVNACESAPLQYVKNVSYSANIWLKNQPYSLVNMLHCPELATAFSGGSVYQAFLSALSYHCWHSPVDGVITQTEVVPGTYYLEHPAEGIYSPDPDPSAPNASQPFITSVAARAVIFIQADNSDIGLMAIVAVGMAEVSSCEIIVPEGKHVNKGDKIGMFHFGGSTHCLVFRPGVELEFDIPVTSTPNLDSDNVAVKSNLARLKAT